MPNIGENLRNLREQASLTQKELGDRFGVAAATVSRWETNDRSLPVAILPKLARTLRCEITDFFKE